MGVDDGSAVFWPLAVLQGTYNLTKIELLVNSDQQMVGIDKVPQAVVSELGQGGVSPVPV